MTAQPPRDDRPQQVLEYATPESNRPAGGVGYAGQIALGFAAFVAALIVGLTLAGAIGSATDGSPILLIGPVIAVGALTYLTVTAHRRWRWRGFLIGVLGTLGLLLLAVGLCFAILLR